MKMAFRRKKTLQGMAALAGAGLCALAGAIAPQAQASPAASSPYNWHVAKVFGGQPYANLLSMTAISAKDAWLFGDGAKGRDVALHFNGSTWTPSYPFGSLPRPQSASATAAGNIWVAGGCTSSLDNYVARYNGRKWTTDLIKPATARDATFCDATVVTTGPASGWLFGRGGAALNATKALHFRGGKWVRVTIGNFGTVLAASAVSASDIYLVTYTPADKMLVVRYNGKTWKAVSVPAAPAPKGAHPYPDEIITPGSGNVWIATDLVQTGSDGGGYQINASRLLHYDGAKWTWVTVPGTDNAYNIAYDAGIVWVAGQQSLPGPGTGWDFQSWNGRKWADVAAPSAGIPGTGVSYEIYNLVRIPGTHSFWADGDASYSSPSSQQEQAAVVFKYGP
jgi:hypothetical protein